MENDIYEEKISDVCELIYSFFGCCDVDAIGMVRTLAGSIVCLRHQAARD